MDCATSEPDVDNDPFPEEEANYDPPTSPVDSTVAATPTPQKGSEDEAPAASASPEPRHTVETKQKCAATPAALAAAATDNNQMPSALAAAAPAAPPLEASSTGSTCSTLSMTATAAPEPPQNQSMALISLEDLETYHERKKGQLKRNELQMLSQSTLPMRPPPEPEPPQNQSMAHILDEVFGQEVFIEKKKEQPPQNQSMARILDEEFMLKVFTKIKKEQLQQKKLQVLSQNTSPMPPPPEENNQMQAAPAAPVITGPVLARLESMLESFIKKKKEKLKQKMPQALSQNTSQVPVPPPQDAAPPSTTQDDDDARQQAKKVRVEAIDVKLSQSGSEDEAPGQPQIPEPPLQDPAPPQGSALAESLTKHLRQNASPQDKPCQAPALITIEPSPHGVTKSFPPPELSNRAASPEIGTKSRTRKNLDGWYVGRAGGLEPPLRKMLG